MSSKKLFLILILLIIAGSFFLWSQLFSSVEQPQYIVLESNKSIEIREYEPMIIAEVIVNGERSEAISTGFSYLADYIFGNNILDQKIAMTAPVIQTKGEKIAMTAPVIQEGLGNSWRVYFVMPKSYQLESLPKPLNPMVSLKRINEQRVAAIQFSGRSSDELIEKNENILRHYLQKNNIEVYENSAYAFYNPPWTLPIFRRNEVIVKLK